MFGNLFKKSKIACEIEVLKDELDSHGKFTAVHVEHVSDLNTVYVKRFIDAERKIKALAELPSVIEKLTKLVKKLEERIGKQELMHVDIFKKQNDLFESAMNTLIKESGNFNRHALDYAAEQIEKVEAEHQFVNQNLVAPLIPVGQTHVSLKFNEDSDKDSDKEESRPWNKMEFTLNGEITIVPQPGIISYEELIEKACAPLPPRKDTKFSVEFSLAGGKRQEGTLEPGGKIEVTQGTIVDVMGD